jgi:hypothetical protein
MQQAKYVLKKGDRFGKLTVQSYNPAKHAWLCVCDCGGKTHAKTWGLKNGKHKSCKCGIMGDRPQSRLPNDLGMKRAVFKNYQRAAARRGHAFDLSEDDFVKMIDQPCFYCGQKPSSIFNYSKYTKKSKDRKLFYSGVDRVDNSKGYSRYNCVPCCAICNQSKAQLSINDWKSWIIKVALAMKLFPQSTLPPSNNHGT